MSGGKNVPIVDIDYETEDVIISCSVADGTVTTCRCRILYGWLILYLLDPEPFDDIGREFCEGLLATNPSIGLVETNAFVLLDLPNGRLTISADDKTKLRDALAVTLVQFSESIADLF